MFPLIPVLAASSNRLGSVTGYFSQQTSIREALIFVLFACVIGSIWAAILFWDRLRKLAGAVPEPPKSIFEELCRAHRLSQQDVTLLTEAAQECRAASPAALFVQPEVLQTLSVPSEPKANVYRALHEKLFGSL